jgi:hypothetical protein
MRRSGLVLAGLGTCLIVFALLQAFWVTGQVVKFPLNQYATVTLTDPDATYFSAAKLTEMSGVNLEATYTIKGNAAAGSSSTAVWNQFIYVYDQSNKQAVQTITRTFAFDRRTAQLVNCCGANVNGDSSIQQSGYVGYVLPIGTKKQTYDVFDTNLNKPVPFTYAGVGDVDGTQAYKFTVNVAPTQNGTQTVPGSLVNQSAASVTLPQFYEVHSTYWIDPVTGALLNVTQNEKLTLRNTDGSTALSLLSANLVANQASIDGLVAIDNNQLTKASLVGTLLPLIAGIVGLLLLIIGLVVGRRPERGAEAAPSRHEPELAEAEPAAATRSLVPGLDDEPHDGTIESPVVREAAVSQAEAGEEEAAAREKATPAATAGAAGAATAAAAAGAEAKAAEGEAAAADTKAADAEASAEQAEAKAEDKAAGAEPASPAAADGAATQAAEAKAEAAQAETTADNAQAEAEAKGEEAKAAEAKAGDAPAEAATAEIPAVSADTAESPAPTDADTTAESPAADGSTSRRRRGAHRR